MPPPLRRSRATVAGFIVAGTAAFGVGAIGSAASSSAAPAVHPDAPATQCTLLPCPAGSITSVSVAETSGSIVVTWNPDSGSGDHIDTSNPAQRPSVRVIWEPTTNPPAGAPQPPSPPDRRVTGSCDPSSGMGKTVCTFAWPADLTSNGYILNGTYKISASAIQCNTLLFLCSTAYETPSQTKEVAIPAKPPTNVKAVLAPNQADTAITWDPSPEPDVQGYRVSRVSGGNSTDFYQCRLPTVPSTPAIPACPATLSATDVAPGGGTYTYQVLAYRYGATYASTPLEAKSAASKSVTVPGPPAVTTTTVKGAGSTSTAGGLPAFGAFNNKVTPVKPAGTGTNSFAAPGPAISVPGAPDPGFQPVLPYQPAGNSNNSPTSDPAVVGQTSPAPKGKGTVRSIALIGAGLLVAVVAFHGLWLRSEVKRASVLEVLEPET